MVLFYQGYPENIDLLNSFKSRPELTVPVTTGSLYTHLLLRIGHANRSPINLHKIVLIPVAEAVERPIEFHSALDVWKHLDYLGAPLPIPQAYGVAYFHISAPNSV